MAERILSKRVPLGDVLLLIFYSLPGIIALSLPFAALVGSLMSIGKFSQQNEIIALQASGVSLRRVFIPIFAFGVFFSAFSFVMNDYFLPLGTLRFNKLYRDLSYTYPELEIESYSIKIFQDSIIANGLVKGHSVETLFILDREAQGGKRIIMAESATIGGRSAEGVISLSMKNVTSHWIAEDDKTRYTYTFADTMEYNLLLKNISEAFRNPSPREMSFRDVYAEMRRKREALAAKVGQNEFRTRLAELEYRTTYRSLVNRLYAGGISYQDAIDTLVRLDSAVSGLRQRTFTDTSLQTYLIEFHKKFSLPASCIAFVIFSFPVGLFTHRSGRSVGFGIGLFVSIFYWGLLFAGQTLGSRSHFPAFWAMWIPDIVILLLGLAAGIVKALK